MAHQHRNLGSKIMKTDEHHPMLRRVIFNTGDILGTGLITFRLDLETAAHQGVLEGLTKRLGGDTRGAIKGNVIVTQPDKESLRFPRMRPVVVNMKKEFLYPPKYPRHGDIVNIVVNVKNGTLILGVIQLVSRS